MDDNTPQLYREEHVVTEDDLVYMIDTYKATEKALVAQGRLAEAQQACACHSIAEHILAWLQAGKPKGGAYEIDEQPD